MTPEAFTSSSKAAEQEHTLLGHVVVIGGVGAEQMANYFAKAAVVTTLTTPHAVREHFYTNPPVDVLITGIGIQDGGDKMQGVEIASAVRDFYPEALTVLVASAIPAVENRGDYKRGYDYMIPRHILMEQEEKAIAEGRTEFREFIQTVVQAKKEGGELPEHPYYEVTKVVDQPELKLLAQLAKTPDPDDPTHTLKPTPDEALGVTTSTAQIPDDVIEKIHKWKQIRDAQAVQADKRNEERQAS